MLDEWAEVAGGRTMECLGVSVGDNLTIYMPSAIARRARNVDDAGSALTLRCQDGYYDSEPLHILTRYYRMDDRYHSYFDCACQPPASLTLAHRPDTGRYTRLTALTRSARFTGPSSQTSTGLTLSASMKRR